jgi:hypothetical protein
MLPHEPAWNLVPCTGQSVPWECTWHGTQDTPECARCIREHAEYMASGTWEEDWPEGCRCVITDGRRQAPGGCPLHLYVPAAG